MIRQNYVSLWAGMTCLLIASMAFGQQPDPFASHIRPTPPRTPEAEQRSFQVPPGFRVDLVAAEPDIFKPMNMAFDSQGRLWVSSSVEYPYAADINKPGRDKISVLADTNGDGAYDSNTTFVDGLNIPIGLYPYGDGVVAYSIPNIWHFRDTDGDGRADKRVKLYGPMGYERDTHGMNNAFRRGFDGWLYACHGFNNETTVQGTDGHVVKMHSGNTYRMKLDGSRIEQVYLGAGESVWDDDGLAWQFFYRRLSQQADLSTLARGVLSELWQAARWSWFCAPDDAAWAWLDGDCWHRDL